MTFVWNGGIQDHGRHAQTRCARWIDGLGLVVVDAQSYARPVVRRWLPWVTAVIVIQLLWLITWLAEPDLLWQWVS